MCTSLGPAPASPIVSGHQLPHALAYVDRLNLLGLEAEIAGPDSRGLGGQQPVGTLSHARALTVEPLLAGGQPAKGPKEEGDEREMVAGLEG